MEAQTVDVYCRVSRVGDREHLSSPEDQEREARAFARARGLTVGEVVCDLNESGSTLDRPGFAKVLGRIERGESAGVVVAYLSRASRDTAQGLGLLERITALGGAVYAPNLPDYTTPDGLMLTTIQLAIDTGYLHRKAAEFEHAKAGAIAAGVPVANRIPVGYAEGPRAANGRRGSLRADAKAAPVVREVFERRAQGVGPTELGKVLEDAKVRTSAGSALVERVSRAAAPTEPRLSRRAGLRQGPPLRERERARAASRSPDVDRGAAPSRARTTQGAQQERASAPRGDRSLRVVRLRAGTDAHEQGPRQPSRLPLQAPARRGRMSGAGVHPRRAARGDGRRRVSGDAGTDGARGWRARDRWQGARRGRARG